MNPKFKVGDRVKRLANKHIVGAEILEVIITASRIIYHIKYDEGPSFENDGTGYWTQECLNFYNK